MDQESINAKYLRVGNVMKKYGKPNATFTMDFDITYKELFSHVSEINGLLNILKTMKQKVNLVFED